MTETLRLYQLLPCDPADSVAVHDEPLPPELPPLDEPTVMLEFPLPPLNASVARIW